MFCTNCGKQIDDNSKFCIHCGNTIEEEAVASDKIQSNNGAKPLKAKPAPKKMKKVRNGPPSKGIKIALLSLLSIPILALTVLLVFSLIRGAGNKSISTAATDSNKSIVKFLEPRVEPDFDLITDGGAVFNTPSLSATATSKPIPSSTPELTTTPELTSTPELTPAPELTSMSEQTATPESTSTPKATPIVAPTATANIWDMKDYPQPVFETQTPLYSVLVDKVWQMVGVANNPNNIMGDDYLITLETMEDYTYQIIFYEDETMVLYENYMGEDNNVEMDYEMMDLHYLNSFPFADGTGYRIYFGNDGLLYMCVCEADANLSDASNFMVFMAP